MKNFMGRKGEQTRREILKIAEGLVLERGFASTSIEQIIDKADITKGGFFYHFEGKNDLARALIVQYLKDDDVFFKSLLSQARDLSEDPLQQMLIFLKLLASKMLDVDKAHPGCLVASFTYESQQFNEEVIRLIAESFLLWRELFVEQLERVYEKRTPRIEVSAQTLADMLSTIIEGGIVVSRAMNEKQPLPDQILQYRNYIRLLFGEA